MISELRSQERYEDFGRIECPEICIVNGVLNDISINGCKVHFDAPITINLEDDYELHVRLSHSAQAPLILMCHPQWVKSDNDTADVGFLIMRSPDTARLKQYVSLLHSELTTSDELLPQEVPCQFV
ncbi:MAG: PilZ domain-containing protein [Treponema sp.]|nr:PilZ domain-containing protein [Treponema sp.]